jgi:chromatin remodeling complex protein RSC6
MLTYVQDPEDRRWIVCDDRLTALFGKKKIQMFKMNKDLSKLFGEKVGMEKADEEEEEEEEEDGDAEDAERNTGNAHTHLFDEL